MVYDNRTNNVGRITFTLSNIMTNFDIIGTVTIGSVVSGISKFASNIADDI